MQYMALSCHAVFSVMSETIMVFHISVESNQFSFELAQRVQLITFFIIGLAVYC